MAADVVSVRLSPDARARIDAAARRSGASRSALVQRLLEEGVRMDAHPGIVFRDGPAGRRPALAGGPDVWEVARIVRNAPERGDAVLLATAAWLDLSPTQVEVAVDYYSAYAVEIDAWIDALDEQADAAEAAAEARAALLG